MAATSHPEFNEDTKALEVASAFSEAIRGRTIVVTGVNLGGVGFTTAEAFASQAPAHLIVTGRTPSKLQQSIDALKAKYPAVDYRLLQMDLSSQASVRAAAATVLAWADVPTIDILVNNAAVALLPERRFSEDGIELTFATNHVGHFLFTCLIMPKLIRASSTRKGGAVRIVNVSSGSPRFAGMRWSDINFDRTSADLPAAEQPNYELHRMWGIPDAERRSYTPLEAYNQSKVANVLFGVALTRRLYARHGIFALAVHPGVIRTELARDASPEILDAVKAMGESGVYRYKTAGAGSATGLVAALDPKLAPPAGAEREARDGRENHGAFLMDCQISSAAQPRAVSSAEAERLWELSEELVKEKFSW